MTFAELRLYASPEAATHKIMAIANGIVPLQDCRILVERINGPFLSNARPRQPNIRLA
jgi:hypothetical protein